MKAIKLRRHIVNCRKVEARDAYHRAVLLTRKQILLRDLSWLEMKIELAELWLWHRRKQAALLIGEIIGSVVVVYWIYRLSLVAGPILGGRV